MTDQPDELRLPWSRSERAFPRTVVRPLQDFLQTSTSSATLLFGALVIALVWANVGETYERFWHTAASVRLGSFEIAGDLHFWVNDGLMTVFFLLVGIEIKRELTTGELQNVRAAALPAIAAIGGMVVPAALFLIIAAGGEAQRGWAVPMATDIALALGALALVARAPGSIKPLLLTLAIVDDIGAIVVIALFYSEGGSWTALVLAFLLLAVVAVCRKVHIRATVPYVVLGAGVWYFTYRAGVHPTIAGVALGLLTPSVPFQRPAAVSAEAKATADATVDDPDPPDADAHRWLRLSWLSREAVSPLARVEHTLLPWSSFLIVPLFALANAGVHLSAGAIREAFTTTLGLAITVGLVAGKPIGVWLAARAAVATRVGELPPDVTWHHVIGVGAIAGIGFTVALFVAELAFADSPVLLARAKVAVLVASALAVLVSQIVLRAARPHPVRSRSASASA